VRLEEFVIPPTDPEDPALLHFTSETTGSPRALHVNQGVLYPYSTGKLCFGFAWGHFLLYCRSGWVTGTSYGIIAPLVNRASLYCRWSEIMDDWGVFHLEKPKKFNAFRYTAPTAIRSVDAHGKICAQKKNWTFLFWIGAECRARGGGPFIPELVTWGRQLLELPTWKLVQTRNRRIIDLPIKFDEVKPVPWGKTSSGE